MKMRDSWTVLLPLLVAGCFEEDVGVTNDAALDSRVVSKPDYCSPQPDALTIATPDASLAVGYSNGVAPLSDLDPDHVVTIDGTCTFNTDIGEVKCNDLLVRPNVPGVWEGIGYERVAPAAPTCAGDAGAPAPQIGVFSFGSLVMQPGSHMYFRGRRAIGLVAVKTINLVDVIGAYGEHGGFTEDDRDFLGGAGPAPGYSSTAANDLAMGAAGAGGLSAGGAGGNCGQPIGAPRPQFEPLCGGSTGGSVGHLSDNGHGGGVRYASGGDGGGAIVVAAGESITFSGAELCGLFAPGAGGGGSDYGGAGGGSGGTILLEAPVLNLGGCWVTANGGGGGAGENLDSGWGACGSGTDAPAPGGLGVDPGGHGGARDSRATAGADGARGGGGGGAAGFIRIRTGDCDALPDNISPRPTCETLAPPPDWYVGDE